MATPSYLQRIQRLQRSICKRFAEASNRKYCLPCQLATTYSRSVAAAAAVRQLCWSITLVADISASINHRVIVYFAVIGMVRTTISTSPLLMLPRHHLTTQA
jgi:hypothetical protein